MNVTYNIAEKMFLQIQPDPDKKNLGFVVNRGPVLKFGTYTFQIDKIPVTDEENKTPASKFSELPMHTVSSEKDLVDLDRRIHEHTKVSGRSIVLHNTSSIAILFVSSLPMFDLVKYDALPENEFVLLVKGANEYDGSCFAIEQDRKLKYFYRPNLELYVKRFIIV